MSQPERSLRPTALTIVKSKQDRPLWEKFFASLVSAFSKINLCRHRKMSWPITHDGDTYRVCSRCGMRRRFDLQTWKTKGPYYNETVIVRSINARGATTQARKVKDRAHVTKVAHASPKDPTSNVTKIA